MKEIEKPSLVIDEISPDGRYGKFVWEPLERGYGGSIWETSNSRHMNKPMRESY